MAYYNIEDLSPQQQQVVRNYTKETSQEQMAENINSLEDLAQFHKNLPAGQLKNETKKLIDEYVTQADTMQIDIVKTLKKYFTLRDQNVILQNVQLLSDMVDTGNQ